MQLTKKMQDCRVSVYKAVIEAKKKYERDRTTVHYTGDFRVHYYNNVCSINFLKYPGARKFSEYMYYKIFAYITEHDSGKYGMYLSPSKQVLVPNKNTLEIKDSDIPEDIEFMFM